MYKSILLISLAACSAPLSGAGTDTYHLVWSEEFNEINSADSPAWTIVEGNGCPSACGFGNNERQTYTSEHKNLRTEGGALIIEAHKNETYTSAKITSQKLPGWTYGKISVRAKLPKGVGTWPAIWMLPDDSKHGSWPKSGEIDIMEHVGFNEGHVHGTVHTEAYNHKIGTQKGGDIFLPSATNTFHTYTITWTDQTIFWLIDGQQYFRFDKQASDTTAEWPFDNPFHLILNLAIGGDWGGIEGVDEKAFPARFEIDWVKVWQRTAR
tara:strand:- start:1478 stop:2278 length:801 start_codon:yes stop_codon:yes gene_type:complete